MNPLPLMTESASTVINSFDDLIGRFLCSQDIKQNSKDTYRKALKHFAQWITRENIYNPVREDVLAYKHFLEAAGDCLL